MSRAWVDTTPIPRNLQKQKPWRSEKYKAYIRTLDCCVTGAPAECAHHVIGVGLGGVMGSKVDDSLVIPLTSEIHHELHATSVKEWEDKYGLQLLARSSRRVRRLRSQQRRQRRSQAIAVPLDRHAAR